MFLTNITKINEAYGVKFRNKNKKEQGLYVLLIMSQTRFGKMMKFLGMEYSHCSLSLDKTLRYNFAFSDDGFVMEDIRFNKEVSKSKYALYFLPLNDEEYKYAKIVLERFIANKDSFTYSDEGLVRFALKRPKEYDNKFFCSEFVAYVCQMINPNYIDKRRGLVKPDDFTSFQGFRLIDKGDRVDQYDPKKVKFD